MKKRFLMITVLVSVGGSLIAQTWNGSTPGLIYYNEGNVGVGTTSPQSKLEITGNGSYLRLNPENGVVGSSITSGQSINIIFNDNKVGNDFFSIRGAGDTYSTSIEHLRINHLGNVGIGTIDTKGFKLGVKGKIISEEVKIASYSNWADFVFKKDYDLPTLKEVEEHIEKEGHLKDIPDAKEVEQDGFYLAQMDAKLLQKIEELTLYVIQQDKKIRLLEHEKTELERLNESLTVLQRRIEELEKKDD